MLKEIEKTLFVQREFPFACFIPNKQAFGVMESRQQECNGSLVTLQGFASK